MQDLEYNGININLVNAATVATAAAATLATTNATSALINGAFATPLAGGAGKALSLVSQDGITARPAQAMSANQSCVIVNCVNAAGQMRNIQGPIQNMDAGVLVNPVAFPRVPDNLTAFSYVVVRAGATSAGFTPGVTNWNATGITTTVVDIGTLPGRPVYP
jgi:hypothetical protein